MGNHSSSVALPPARDAKLLGEGSVQPRYFMGKRIDGKGWDLIVLHDADEPEIRGPYRLKRDAWAALLTYPKIDAAPPSAGLGGSAAIQTLEVNK